MGKTGQKNVKSRKIRQYKKMWQEKNEYKIMLYTNNTSVKNAVYNEWV